MISLFLALLFFAVTVSGWFAGRDRGRAEGREKGYDEGYRVGYNVAMRETDGWRS